MTDVATRAIYVRNVIREAAVHEAEARRARSIDALSNDLTELIANVRRLLGRLRALGAVDMSQLTVPKIGLAQAIQRDVDNIASGQVTDGRALAANVQNALEAITTIETDLRDRLETAASSLCSSWLAAINTPEALVRNDLAEQTKNLIQQFQRLVADDGTEASTIEGIANKIREILAEMGSSSLALSDELRRLLEVARSSAGAHLADLTPELLTEIKALNLDDRVTLRFGA